MTITQNLQLTNKETTALAGNWVQSIKYFTTFYQTLCSTKATTCYIYIISTAKPYIITENRKHDSVLCRMFAGVSECVGFNVPLDTQ